MPLSEENRETIERETGAVVTDTVARLGSVTLASHTLDRLLSAARVEAATTLERVERERDEALRMLDRYDAPTHDEGEDCDPLSLADRIEAMVYMKAVASDGAHAVELRATQAEREDAFQHISSWKARAQAAEAQVEALRNALEPFAEAFRTLSSRWQDHEDNWQSALHRPLTVGQLRAANEALSAQAAESS